jgi:hypothetical protein
MKEIIPNFDSYMINEAEINKRKGDVNLKNVYIALKTVSGDLGPLNKGEIYIKSKSEEGSEYVFLRLANPGYEHYSDIELDTFKECFRQIDPEKDEAQMKLLDKWDLIAYGDFYYVMYVNIDNASTTITAAVKDALSTDVKKYSASSPKQAMIKKGGNPGTLIQVSPKIWVAKMYANWCIVATIENPIELGAAKIINAVVKSGTMKAPVK